MVSKIGIKMLCIAGAVTVTAGLPVLNNLLSSWKNNTRIKVTSLKDDTNCRIYELKFNDQTSWRNWRTPDSKSTFELQDWGKKDEFLSNLSGDLFLNTFSFKRSIKDACKSGAGKSNANGNVYYFESKANSENKKYLKKYLIYSPEWNKWDWVKDGKGQRLN